MRLSSFTNHIRSLCLRGQYRIAFPETQDERIRQTILHLVEEPFVAKIICFATEIQLPSYDQSDSFSKIRNHPRCEWIDPKTLFSDTLSLLSAKQKRPLPDAKLMQLAHDPLYQAGYLLHQGTVDCVIAGSVATTAEVIRAGLVMVGIKPELQTVSGAFVMTREKDDETFVYADCGVLISPTTDQLVDVALASVETFRLVAPHLTPQVAFLSFSTYGSAQHESAEKMAHACQLLRARDARIACDGELQFDAAYLKEIRQKKAPHSPLTDKANIFIFPDLNAGNIAYKITQRLGGFSAYGPLLQGLNKSYSDLSRGASVEDIITTAYINFLRSSPL